MKAKISRTIEAEAGGLRSLPYLHFPIEITSGYSDEVAVTFLPPLVSTVSTVAPNDPVYLGQLTLMGVQVQKLETPQEKGEFNLKFEIDDERIWKVDNARKNADVCLQIRLDGLAFIEEKGRLAYRVDPWSAEVKGIDEQYRYIRIAASDWISFCEKWGYGKRLLLDIPIEFEVARLEKQGLASRLKEAVKGLDQTRNDLARQEWRTVIKDSRGILKLLRGDDIPKHVLATQKTVEEILKESGLPENSADGIKKVIDGLHAFTNPTHHLYYDAEGKKVKIEPPYDKEDALFVAATIPALLNMLIRKVAKS